jgi:MSHA type pilus biogenesis protein MshL
MVKHQLTAMTSGFAARLACLATVASLVSCSAHSELVKSDERLVKPGMIASSGWKDEAPAPPAVTAVPDFVSVSEEIVPIKTKMINIVVRNSSLGDVLHVVAEASGLNLLIDSDVALDQPITLSLRNVSAEDALKTIFSSVDCFYTVTNNMLKVESVRTRVFELGHPALVNTYSIDVGGDILGGAMVTPSGSTGSSSSSGSSNLKGNITSGSKADAKAYDFWETLEKSLDNIVNRKEVTRIAKSSGSRADSKTGNQAFGNSHERQNNETTTIENPVQVQGASSELQSTITVNRLTGTIMVTATRKNMEKVERFIENVRRVLGRQVMIEARIIEVQLNEGLNFGIDWSFLSNVKSLGGPVNAGFGALNMATTTFNDATDLASKGSKFQAGVSRADFQSLLTALKTQGDVKTLSNPKINVMNGHASILTVGRNTSYISKVVTTNTGNQTAPILNFTVETGSILSGMIIGIVPFISETGEISLNITPITSDLVTLLDKNIGSAGNQTTISIPTVDLREMTTTVKMRDGQMVIIGGLISKKATSSEEKVPFIGDIPFFGKLFTRINNSESRSELVLLLRPNIVNND